MTELQPVHRLIYVSRFSPYFPSEREEQDLVLNAILRVSLRRNEAVGVTGLLLVHRIHFMQVLEGAGEAVAETYERIVKDERHTDINLLGVRRADRRQFPDWAMSVRRLNARAGTPLHAPDMAGVADPRGLSFDAALDLLAAVHETRARMLRNAMA